MMKKKPISKTAALTRLEELCARSEQCSYDLSQKLYRWGLPAAEREEVMESLTDRKFVDDSRFARAYVRDKYRFDRWGKMKIVRGLIMKRIGRMVINEALQEIDVREYRVNCYRLLKAKDATLHDDDDDYTRRQKLLRFGAQRGYEAALIVRLLDDDRLWGGEN